MPQRGNPMKALSLLGSINHFETVAGTKTITSIGTSRSYGKLID
jgi:hypothetical protein